MVSFNRAVLATGLLFVLNGCGGPRDPTIEENSHQSTALVPQDQWVAKITINGADLAEIEDVEWRKGTSIAVSTELIRPKQLANLGPGEEEYTVRFFLTPRDDVFDGIGWPGPPIGSVLLLESGKIREGNLPFDSELIEPGPQKIYACLVSLNLTLVKEDIRILKTFNVDILPESADKNAP